ncbi:uncharacterized protein LOC119444086 [Dermacentor silvarum]|uniref:uncharacterized protein LOC119444086 n=1 Tax=Dermacentor silvarum TaxID=543639 RepID=UPI002101111C|nr:uncharacterized protein LOC119444086 [Dermacentor silvarum]
MHLGIKTGYLMLLFAVLVTGTRTEESVNRCHEDATSAKEVQTEEERGCRDRSHRDQNRFLANKHGAMQSGEVYPEEDRVLEQIFSMGRKVKPYIPFVNRRPRKERQGSTSCN